MSSRHERQSRQGGGMKLIYNTNLVLDFRFIMRCQSQSDLLQVAVLLSSVMVVFQSTLQVTLVVEDSLCNSAGTF